MQPFITALVIPALPVSSLSLLDLGMSLNKSILVLLQHAAFYHRTGEPRPACFITVSTRLRNELEPDPKMCVTVVI